MKTALDRIGEKHITNQGYEIEIIAYRKAIDIDVLFDNGYIKKNVTYADFKRKGIEYPYHPRVYGVGFLGEGLYECRVDGKITKCYDVWHSFLKRSYWKGYHASDKSYKNVTVCQEWHNFQNFAEWFYKNYNPKYMEGWHLDKDILVKGNKVYSPETCCFVPREVNNFFTKKTAKGNNLPTGVHVNQYSFKAEVSVGGGEKRIKSFPTIEQASTFYKTEKQEYAKRLVSKWEDVLDIKIKNKLLNYTADND